MFDAAIQNLMLTTTVAAELDRLGEQKGFDEETSFVRAAEDLLLLVLSWAEAQIGGTTEGQVCTSAVRQMVKKSIHPPQPQTADHLVSSTVEGFGNTAGME